MNIYDDVIEITPRYIECLWRSRIGKIAIRRDAIPPSTFRLFYRVERTGNEITVHFMNALGRLSSASIVKDNFKIYEGILIWV